MNVGWGKLSDRPLADAASIAVTNTIYEAVERAGTDWLVITDATGSPIAAATPGALDALPGGRLLADVLHDLPPTVIAPASTTVRSLLASWVADEIEPESAVIVVSNGQILGVWAGADMRRAVAFDGGRAAYWDQELPGEINIPLLTRGCRYREGDIPCTAVKQFPERPAVPPPCDNPVPLMAHAFGW